MGQRAHHYITKLITLLLSTAAPLSAAGAQEYGKVGAVNPEATGTMAGGGSHTLAVGSNVVHKERIRTSAKGSTQLLFPDQSTLNIGGNSNIVIDEFVYNPKDRSGKMAVSATKGVLRFVGGQISHSQGATITTPVAALGVRGGIVTIMLPVPANIAATDPRLAGQGQLVIAHFGYVTLRNGAGSITLRPGFAVIVNSANQPIGQPFRPSDATIHLIVQQLRSTPSQTGGVGHANAPTDSTFSPQNAFNGPNNNYPGHGAGTPGSDPLGYMSIFGAGNAAGTGKNQSAPSYP
jgi:hypothetical protein